MIRRSWVTLLSLLLVLSLLAGCTAQESKPAATPAPAPQAEAAKPDPAKTTYPITLKDAAGRDVTIKGEPQRILSLAPSNTELVFALGLGSKLVGRTDFCDYPADAANIPSIGGIINPNYEQILATKPDLVLMTGGSQEVRDKLTNDHGLTVFVVDPQNFEQVYAGIKMLGTVINAQPAAEQVVADMQKQVAEITGKVAKASSKPKVFYEVWHDPLMTAGKGTFINDLIVLAGGENVGGAVEGWANFSLEQLAAANPDILVASMQGGAEQIRTRQGWESFKAVKEGKVVEVADANVVSRPSPRLVQGLKWFAETLHPEVMK